jgi:hypothetical protein
MRPNAPNERKAVALAILAIGSLRERGDLPVARREIRLWVVDLDEGSLNTTLQWLRDNDLIEKRGDGFVCTLPPKVDLCWTHGTALPCAICARRREKT